MSSLADYERRVVTDASGRRLGRVAAVLFHPHEPQAVGLQVDRTAVLGVFDRRPRFVRLADIQPTESGELAIEGEALPKDADGERRLGFGWQETVVWHHMPVRSSEGEPVGYVHEVEFDDATGSVATLRISTGALGDLAVGRLEVPGSLIRGFDGEAVVIEPSYAQVESSGGAAKAAATGVTVLKERTEQVADGMLQVGAAAAGAIGRSFKKGIGRKAIDKMKSLMNDGER